MSDTGEPAAKRQKAGENIQEDIITLGTHHGHFHADEALAVYMLRMLPRYKNARLVRTRNLSDASRSDYIPALHTVVDVGDVYDPARNRFDHHQRSFATTFPGRPTKLSSAGLVYMHFGRTILAQELAAIRSVDTSSVSENDPDIETVYPQLYESFVEAIDANDNGIDLYAPEDLVPGAQKRFRNGGFTLASVVNSFNPRWTDTYYEDEASYRAAENAKFENASQWMGERFVDAMNYYLRDWLASREYVEKAFEARCVADTQGRILVLERSCPWKEWLFRIEKNAGVEGQLLYILYAENTFKGSPWRIQCVPEAPDSFNSRKPLPKAWRGNRGGELDKITGISGCIFTHNAGFIGGNSSYDGVLEMAKKALDEPSETPTS